MPHELGSRKRRPSYLVIRLPCLGELLFLFLFLFSYFYWFLSILFHISFLLSGPIFLLNFLFVICIFQAADSSCGFLGHTGMNFQGIF